MTTVYFKKGLAKYKTSDLGGGWGESTAFLFLLFFFFYSISGLSRLGD